jgi:hypothetical protein
MDAQASGQVVTSDQVPEPNGPLTPDERDRARAMLKPQQFVVYKNYREGMTVTLNASRAGVSRTRIRHIIHKAQMVLGYEPTHAAKQATAAPTRASKRSGPEKHQRKHATSSACRTLSHCGIRHTSNSWSRHSRKRRAPKWQVGLKGSMGMSIGRSQPNIWQARLASSFESCPAPGCRTRAWNA